MTHLLHPLPVYITVYWSAFLWIVLITRMQVCIVRNVVSIWSIRPDDRNEKLPEAVEIQCRSSCSVRVLCIQIHSNTIYDHEGYDNIITINTTIQQHNRYKHACVQAHVYRIILQYYYTHHMSTYSQVTLQLPLSMCCIKSL